MIQCLNGDMPRIIHRPFLASIIFGFALISLVSGQDGINFRFDSVNQPAAANSLARSDGAFNLNLAPPRSSSFSRQPVLSSFRPLNRQGISPRTFPAPSNFDSPSTTPAPIIDDDQPTRTPTNRFRPPPNLTAERLSRALPSSEASNSLFTTTGAVQGNNISSNARANRISRECFECLCEASTNCNLNSRCQTSDVRNTRCGPYLISYSQWLNTGLSNELTTRESRAIDPAADERAFYECVTKQECAERLIGLYMAKNGFDCDKDGRLDCYDFASIHQGGIDQCHSEALLESQYWADFNACFGFSR